MKMNNLKEEWKHYYNVGDLLKFIKENNIPNDAKILLQRVEDVYFEKHNWKPIKKEGLFCSQERDHHKKIKEGYYWSKDFPDNKPEDFTILSDEEHEKLIEDLKEQYYVCWSPVKYENDDNLYLDAHY